MPEDLSLRRVIVAFAAGLVIAFVASGVAFAYGVGTQWQTVPEAVFRIGMMLAMIPVGWAFIETVLAVAAGGDDTCSHPALRPAGSDLQCADCGEIVYRDVLCTINPWRCGAMDGGQPDDDAPDLDAVCAGDKKDLRDADLVGAYLVGADLRDADLPAYERLPETGAVEVWKGCAEHVVKLRIPEGADRVSSLRGPKCRAERAEVLAVLDAEGEPCDATEARSWYDEEFAYREGEVVEPDAWDDDVRVECSHGIHCYPTKREAVEAVWHV